MKLDVISFSVVRDALDRRSENWNEAQTDSFNSHSHTEAEIASVIPDPVYPHISPDPRTEYLENWLPIIASSQHIERYHTIDLSPQCIEGLLGARNIWEYNAHLSDATLEDLVDLFPSQVTTVIPEDADTEQATTPQGLASVLSHNDYFCRLEACSPKDGCGPVIPRRLEDIIVRLVSSKRACTALAKPSPTADLGWKRLYLLPFHHDMDTSREYRVWCPPDTGMRCIAAISQYRWYSPFQGRTSSNETIQHLAERVNQGATKLHQTIVRRSGDLKDMKSADAWVSENLEREGFTFDVFDTGHEIQLVEVNPFGAMSGCGSCLFHWIKDARILYGLEGEAAFRIIVDDVNISD